MPGAGLPCPHLEKVVFPFEECLFRCPPQSRVDIWTHGLTGAEQLDSINAQELLLPAELAVCYKP